MINKIGEGNHGSVFSINLNKKVKALKISKNINTDIGFSDINEIDITMRLRQPYINPLLDLKVTDLKNYHLTFPLANGTLEKISSKTDPLKYMNQLLLALEYMHKRDIINADIKPANILYFEDEDCVKFNDFGSSTFDDTVLTNSLRGTIAYMAPETLLNMEICKKSDIWSLGLAFLFALYKELPQVRAVMFKESAKAISNPEDLILLVRKDKNLYLSNLQNFVYKSLSRIIDPVIKDVLGKMLKINIEDRKSTSELLNLDVFQRFKEHNDEIREYYPGCNIRLEYLVFHDLRKYKDAYKVFNNLFEYAYEDLVSTVKMLFWSLLNGIDIFNEIITRKYDIDNEKYVAFACFIVSYKLTPGFNTKDFNGFINKFEFSIQKYNDVEIKILSEINYKVYRKNIYSYLTSQYRYVDVDKLFDYAIKTEFEGELSEYAYRFHFL